MANPAGVIDVIFKIGGGLVETSFDGVLLVTASGPFEPTAIPGIYTLRTRV